MPVDKRINYLVSCLVASISTLSLAVTLCLENHTLAGPAPGLALVFIHTNQLLMFTSIDRQGIHGLI